MRNLWLGAVAGAAGLLTISCSDEGMGPLGPSLDPAEAPGLTGEMRIVLPASGDRVRAASSFLVAVEQQVRPGAGAAYAVAEIATDENDWRAIREFQWTAQATDFSVELGSPPSPGAFRLRIVVRDAQDRQIRVTSQVVDLESFGPSALEAAFGEPDRPESPDALWQRPELVAPDRPGSPDALWQRPELVAPDRPESPDALWQRPELVAPDRPAGH